MTRDELLRDLAASREELLAAIDGLPDEQLALPGAMNEWSAKDLVAHVTAWEAEMIKALAQGRLGQRPEYITITPAQEAARNEQWRKEFRRKPLAKVLEDYEAVRQQTMRQVEKLDDGDLNDPRKHPWTEGEALGALIVDGAVDHDREHAAQIREWRKQLETP